MNYPEDRSSLPSLGKAVSVLSTAKAKASSADYGGTECITTRGTLTLKLNDDSVFEFEVVETVEYFHDSPGFSERVGEINRFIEGPWVTEITEFVQKVNSHAQGAWKEQECPRRGSRG